MLSHHAKMNLYFVLVCFRNQLVEKRKGRKEHHPNQLIYQMSCQFSMMKTMKRQQKVNEQQMFQARFIFSNQCSL